MESGLFFPLEVSIQPFTSSHHFARTTKVRKCTSFVVRKEYKWGSLRTNTTNKHGTNWKKNEKKNI